MYGPHFPTSSPEGEKSLDFSDYGHFSLHIDGERCLPRADRVRTVASNYSPLLLTELLQTIYMYDMKKKTMCAQEIARQESEKLVSTLPNTLRELGIQRIRTAGRKKCDLVLTYRSDADDQIIRSEATKILVEKFPELSPEHIQFLSERYVHS